MEFDFKVLALRVWALGFTSIAIGALATMALCLGLAWGPRQLRFALVLTCLSAICALAVYGPFALLVLWEATGLQWPQELRLPLAPLGEALVGFLWLSVMILFEDARITPLRLAPIALLMAISMANLLTMYSVPVFHWLAVPVNVALAAHAFVWVSRGWRGDLVEKRRRLRRPLLLELALVLALVLITQGADFTARGGWIDNATIVPIYATLDVAIAVMAVTICVLFLEPRAVLLSDPTRAPQQKSGDNAHDADHAALAKLEALMTESEIWRREGLTVAALANEVSMPEHRLRVMINGRLGHRNFAAFINTRRIDAARRHLADPAFAEEPISKIAYDLGFASLGPCNRAFK